ncbi:hypothetical protein GWP57_00445 [Gammaproteobacteria bacterium]|jgi:hypothetical protein|nr:hypothetical protein [Gammaproteobacteria bacterium]
MRRHLTWFLAGCTIPLLSVLFAAMLDLSSTWQIVPVILANVFSPAYLYAVDILDIPNRTQYPLAAVANGMLYSALGLAGSCIPAKPRTLRPVIYVGVFLAWLAYVAFFRQ